MAETPESNAAYRDPSLPTEARVNDLLARMDRTEKTAQLGSTWVFQLAQGPMLSLEAAQNTMSNGIGQITRISGASTLNASEAASLANQIQTFLMNETRLGIPAIVHEEICSGLMAREATIYPQAIGVACTWDPELARDLANSIRLQMRAMGSHQGLSPVLDIARDPRWGRTEETFGEDPHLVAQMGLGFVRGLQSDDLSVGVVATAKHFVGYSASEGGMNWAPAHIGARELRDVYLHPFEAVVKEASLESVMNAYHELDGLPCAASRQLLTEILRDEWGFSGTVVADYFAVAQLFSYHHLAKDEADASAMALNAGLDVELPSTDCFGSPIDAALDAGAISDVALDTAVKRVLRQKFELGLFEQSIVDVDNVGTWVRTQEDQQLASTIAERSLVLLKNDGILPITTNTTSVAVIGPNADSTRNLLGDYAYSAHIESLLDLLRSGNNVFAMPIPDDMDGTDFSVVAPTIFNSLAESFSVITYEEGCDVNSDKRSGFTAAVAAASAADMAIMVMGDKSGLTDECTSGESRDRSSLDLPGVQEDLVRAVIDTGTPVVVVLVAGRPCASEWIHEHAAAVLMAWFPGEQGGSAIANALTGTVNPSGKLAISFPRHVGQVPVFYGHKLSGGRSHWKGDYVDGPTSPLYAFGHGLSYTSFEVTDTRTTSDVVRVDGVIETIVTVSNVGDVPGDEVIQLYIRDPQASLTRPVLELKGFQRIHLTPGETRTMRFKTPVGQLGFHDANLEYVVESGDIDVFVGTSSTDLAPVGTVRIDTDGPTTPVSKVFSGQTSIVE